MLAIRSKSDGSFSRLSCLEVRSVLSNTRGPRSTAPGLEGCVQYWRTAHTRSSHCLPDVASLIQESISVVSHGRVTGPIPHRAISVVVQWSRSFLSRRSSPTPHRRKTISESLFLSHRHTPWPISFLASTPLLYQRQHQNGPIRQPSLESEHDYFTRRTHRSVTI